MNFFSTLFSKASCIFCCLLFFLVFVDVSRLILDAYLSIGSSSLPFRTNNAISCSLSSVIWASSLILVVTPVYPFLLFCRSTMQPYISPVLTFSNCSCFYVSSSPSSIFLFIHTPLHLSPHNFHFNLSKSFALINSPNS